MKRSPAHLAILVLAPVAFFCVLAAGVVLVVFLMAALSALGHGSLTAAERRPLVIIGTVIATAGTAAFTLFLERALLGPKKDRAVDVAPPVPWTRLAAGMLCVAAFVLGPPAAREILLRSTISVARHGKWEERQSAIQNLGTGFEIANSPGAFEALKEIALNPAEDSDARQQAAVALGYNIAAKPVLLQLARDPDANVRSAAGVSLPRMADDDETWAAVERLARDDQSLIVREHMAATLAGSQTHPSRAEQRTKLLAELAVGDTPAAALSAARGLGSAGYDAALAIVVDPNQLGGTRIEALRTLGELKDDRAIEFLRAIVDGRAEPGLVPADRETAFREAASGSLARLAGERYEWTLALFFETRTLVEVKSIVAAQAKYRDATGFYDAKLTCLELPATCVAGRDRDESLLGPAIVSLAPRQGYVRTFSPGPPAPREEITAKRASASSITSYTIVAVPEEPFVSGIRAFCADDTGQICFTRDGTAPPVKNGRCPESVPPLNVELYFPDSATAPRECRK